MNVLRLTAMLLGCLAVAAMTAAAAEDKAVDKDKIVGTWQVTKSTGDLPTDATVEFTKDGKMKITITDKGKSFSIPGTYKVKGDKLSITMKAGPKENTETMTIKTLTDTKLVTVDARGKEDEFKKK